MDPQTIATIAETAKSLVPTFGAAAIVAIVLLFRGWWFPGPIHRAILDHQKERYDAEKARADRETQRADRTQAINERLADVFEAVSNGRIKGA